MTPLLQVTYSCLYVLKIILKTVFSPKIGYPCLITLQYNPILINYSYMFNVRKCELKGE
jgi:hypothetical protein